LALPDPGDDFALVKAMWHYARAVGHARSGDVAAGRKEVAAIEAIERGGALQAVVDANVPALQIAQTARAVANGRLAEAAGDLPAAIQAYQQAVEVQDALPYTEPPYWYYPIRQSLAAALLQAGRYAEAKQQFDLALRKAPANGWSYYGLAELHKARGDSAAARKAEADLAKTWIDDRKLLQISNL
jgi:tetratricopeptide (TPR) repeat protein